MKTRAFVIVLLAIIFTAPAPLFALGEYDGVWFGVDNWSVCGEQGSEHMGVVIYQESDDMLWVRHLEIGVIKLIKSGGQWALASPQDATYKDGDITLKTMNCYFSGANNLQGDITYTLYENGQKYPGYTTIDYYRVESQALSNGAELSNLSAGEDSLRCFEIELSLNATNLNIETWGGSGDCDLYLIFSRPDFDTYWSEGGSNWEEIFVPSPDSGKWYIVLYGCDSYSGVNIAATYDAGDWVSISGDITTQDGTPVCAMALANGQYMFSSNPRGKYNLSVPLNENGQVTLFAFADGFAPFKYIFTPEGGTTDIDVMMLRAPPNSRQITLTCQFDDTAENPGWTKISGQALAENGGTPLCAMVLANGQYMFSNAGNGEYELEVPLDENGQVTLFGFADGFQPFKTVLNR
jgi:hypothetical protein